MKKTSQDKLDPRLEKGIKSYFTRLEKKTRPKKRIRVSALQKKFAKIVAQTGDLKKATLEVYGAGATRTPEQVEAKGKEIVATEGARQEILKIWMDAGLTLEAAALRHKDVLEDVTARHSDILKAVDMIYEGYGVFGSGKDKSEGGKISAINIFIQQRQARGLPIPEGVILNAEVVKP